MDITNSDRAMKTIRALYERGEVGGTWFEIAEQYGWHHGQASAVLSTLHREQRISRLTERRDKCYVYVDNSFVNGRETTPYGRERKFRYSDAEVDTYIDAAFDDAIKNIVAMAHIAKSRSMVTHYNGCWRDHASCALVAAAQQVKARKSDGISKERAS